MGQTFILAQIEKEEESQSRDTTMLTLPQRLNKELIKRRWNDWIEGYNSLLSSILCIIFVYESYSDPIGYPMDQ